MTSDSSTPVSPRRRAWTAAILSLFCPGLGHLHAGRLTRGLILFLLSVMIVPVAALVAGLVPSTTSLVGLFCSYLVLLALGAFAAIDSFRIAARDNSGVRTEYQHAALYGLFLAAGFVSGFLTTTYIRRNLLEAFYLPTASMAPTFRYGDRILANKAVWRIRDIQRWDVVVFRPPDERNRIHLKRIIGLSGDKVTVEGEDVKVNGRRVEMPAVDSTPEAAPHFEPLPAPQAEHVDWLVPPGMCFVLGDNLRNSRDSRHYGLVALGDILGVAEYIYLPADSWSRFGRLP